MSDSLRWLPMTVWTFCRPCDYKSLVIQTCAFLLQNLNEMLLMFMLDQRGSCCYLNVFVSLEPCLSGTIGSVDWSPNELCRFSGEILFGRANFGFICGVILYHSYKLFRDYLGRTPRLGKKVYVKKC